jgi:hypothetical protein
MLRLLACRLLKTKTRLLAASNAARKGGKIDVSGEPKETAVSREVMPADGSNPA